MSNNYNSSLQSNNISNFIDASSCPYTYSETDELIEEPDVEDEIEQQMVG